MLTITVNTFENIDKKIHNDPRKTLGYMYIYFRGDILWLNYLVSSGVLLHYHINNNNNRLSFVVKDHSTTWANVIITDSCHSSLSHGNSLKGAGGDISAPLFLPLADKLCYVPPFFMSQFYSLLIVLCLHAAWRQFNIDAQIVKMAAYRIIQQTISAGYWTGINSTLFTNLVSGLAPWLTYVQSWIYSDSKAKQ